MQHTDLCAAEVDAEFLDVSFQIVHAIYTMERVLHEISSRSASFEIVFWHGELIYSVPPSNLTGSTRQTLPHASDRRGRIHLVVPYTSAVYPL